MKEDQVKDVIETLLISSWGNKTPIAWDNVTFKSEAGISYIEPTTTTTNSTNISKYCQRQNCLLTIKIYTPEGNGTKESGILSSDLLNIFCNKKIDNVVFEKGHSERIGIFKGFFQRRAIINFWYHLTLGV